MSPNFDDLRLLWPAELVLSVVRRQSVTTRDALYLLLTEAFVDARGLDPVRDGELPGGSPAIRSDALGPVWGAAAATADSVALSGYVVDLLQALKHGEIGAFKPVPYFRRRTRREEPGPAQPLRGQFLAEALLKVLIEFDRAGYFDDAFGSSCSDESWQDRVDSSAFILKRDLDEETPWTWPPSIENVAHLELSDEELLSHVYDLVELCHDLAARPRTRTWHSFHKEWDFAEYDHLAGRMVYRWRINSILDGSVVHLRLSRSGPDEGRLVHTPGDPRALLPARALFTAPTPTERDQMQHAISQFVARAATRHDKRDALRNLAGLLEPRREEVKERLSSQDARDLFQIINKFDIRHQGKEQSGDYDEAFLDWIFWTLLSSLALMDSLTGTTSGPRPTGPAS